MGSAVSLGAKRPGCVVQLLEASWGEIQNKGSGGSLANRLQMLTLYLLVIAPLRAVGPVACGYWGWRILRRLRGRPVMWSGQSRPLRGRVCHGLQEILKMWLSVEAFFLFYYLHKSRQFQAQTAKPPQIPKGQVLPMLRRMFQATEDIQEWGRAVENGSRPSQLWTPPQLLSPKSSAQDLQQYLHPQVNESNVEELLREWESRQREAQAQMAPSSPSTICARGRALERMLDDAEMLALKHAEVSGWFVVRSTGSCERWPAVRLGEICRGNMEEFLAWAFYHCTPDTIPEDRRQEFEDLFLEGSRWVGLSFPDGYNPDAQPMRVTMDRIISQHRPFAWYATTAWVLPFVTAHLLSGLGFRQYKSGTLSYWHCVAKGGAEANPSDSPGSSHGTSGTPIVFVHGLGLNLLPYYLFIVDLLRLAPGRTILLVSLPHISMRLQEHVPSSAETVACLSDMLASWGFSSAHFIGHSFGSLPLAWMVRRAPCMVSMATFVDPVCFLVIKPDVCYNFLYRRPSTPSQLMTNFFLARELFIAYSLSRNFFWFMNLLWPEDVTMPSLVALSGQDAIVPAHSVRRYLAVYKRRHGLDSLKVLWFPDHAHGECFLPGRRDERRSILEEALLMESARTSQSLQASPVQQRWPSSSLGGK